MQVNAGQVLWRPGDVSDSFYIVINGRLRAIDDKEDGKVTVLGEYGQGDSVSLSKGNFIHLFKSWKGRRAGRDNAVSEAHNCPCNPRYRVGSHAANPFQCHFS